ncbi:MAG TPA: hypothetical protein VK012_00710 [Gemmatimonadales bacterium]|nr:hypothetical protein [Gemmatimonadales bacterium]
MHAELLILRIIHILGGIFWVGSALFMAVFLFPALGSAGPAAGQVMAGLQRRKIFIVLPAIALLTILSGTRLMQVVSDGFSPEYFRSGSGRAFAWGGVIAIAALLFGLLVSRPIGMRLGRLDATPVPDDAEALQRRNAEREGLQRKAMLTGMFNLVLIVLAAVAMSVARYL